MLSRACLGSAVLLALALAGVASCGDDASDGPVPIPTTSTTTSAGGAAAGTGGVGGAGATSATGGAPSRPGETCEDAVDVPADGTTVTLGGEFESDGNFMEVCNGGTDVWFQVTPPESACYRVDTDLGLGSSFHVIFEGDTCDPLGREVVCANSTVVGAESEVSLQGGTTYLVGLGGQLPNGAEISVTVRSSGPGTSCWGPLDVSNATFPLEHTGNFLCHQGVAAGSCALEPTDTVWLSYTPTSTGNHTITLTNQALSCGDCLTNLAVFEGTGCDPFGTEVDCAIGLGGGTATTDVTLTAGTPYLLAFSSRFSDPMIDPIVTITGP